MMGAHMRIRPRTTNLNTHTARASPMDPSQILAMREASAPRAMDPDETTAASLRYIRFVTSLLAAHLVAHADHHLTGCLLWSTRL